MKCSDCVSYLDGKQQCHRFPNVIEKLPSDWCSEFKEDENAKRVREDAERVSAARVEEERSANKSRENLEQQAQNESSWPPAREVEPVVKRGRPRK